MKVKISKVFDKILTLVELQLLFLTLILLSVVCARYNVKTFDMPPGCNITITLGHRTSRCVALFRVSFQSLQVYSFEKFLSQPKSGCTNLLVQCHKFNLPNLDETNCKRGNVMIVKPDEHKPKRSGGTAALFQFASRIAAMSHILRGQL